MPQMTTFLIGIIGTIVSIGIGALIKGQSTIKNEAKAARKILHEKIEHLDTKLDDYSGRLIQIETFHKNNHPGQL